MTCLKAAYELKTIGKPNSQSMMGIDVYIIVDPDTIKENPTPNYVDAGDIKFPKNGRQRRRIVIHER